MFGGFLVVVLTAASLGCRQAIECAKYGTTAAMILALVSAISAFTASSMTPSKQRVLAAAVAYAICALLECIAIKWWAYDSDWHGGQSCDWQGKETTGIALAITSCVVACVTTGIICRAGAGAVGTAAANPIGLLPLEPTAEVLQKMPVDMILEVMNGNKREHVTFSAWDFAGQDIYYSVHSLFITSGIYVVTFSMLEARQTTSKYLESLSFWMNSVHAHISDPTDYHILIVGTHRDVVHEPADHQIISEQIKSTFQECGFWCRVTQPDEFNGHLCFFPMDNTETVQNRERSQLHAAISSLGQELVESTHQEYPLRWLQVLDELNRKAASGTNFMVIDHPTSQNDTEVFALPSATDDNSLYSVARQHITGQTPLEFNTLCSFLKQAGSFLIFQNLLIIRPQWIADILFAIVTRPQYQAHAASRLDSHSEWLQFEASAVASDRLLKLLWAKFHDKPELLIGVMLHHDQMFELHSTTGRQFLVPAMLPNTQDLVEDDHGELIRLNGLRSELNKIGACFGDGQTMIASSSSGSAKSVSDWPVPDRKPACYLVFGQAPAGEAFGATSSASAHGFVPEGLWFKLLVRCARWAQETDNEWSREHLAKSFRRDVARFSFGAQHFELRLHRAEQAIRLVVLGDSCKYPRGVLQRVRSLVDGALADHFPALEYFIALRIETGGAESRLVNLDTAIGQVERRDFATTDSFCASIIPNDSSASGLVAVDKHEVDFMTCHPWCSPQDSDSEFDVFISHCDADAEFACKVHDCFAKYNLADGGRVRVFLRNVSCAHTSRQITAETAIHSSAIFVPVVSMKAIHACGATGIENIPLKALSSFEVASEYFAVGLTVSAFVINLLVVLTPHQHFPVALRGLFFGSMVVPRVFNTMFLVYTVAQEKGVQSRFVVWLHKNLQAFSLVALLVCLRLDNFTLLQCRSIGRRLFDVPPPLQIASVNRSKALGIVSTLCGDLPQLIISVMFLQSGHDLGSTETRLTWQVSISTISFLHQLIFRGLAFVLVSAPYLEQQWLDQIIESGQILDCMLARHVFRRNARRGQRKLAVVLPIVVDQECLGVAFSPDPVPVQVMEQFTEITTGASHPAHRAQVACAGTLLSDMVHSIEAIKLWGLPVDGWSQCDAVARAVTMRLDMSAQRENDGDDASDHDEDDKVEEDDDDDDDNATTELRRRSDGGRIPNTTRET
jgi:GTPase SAR1 family protein